MQAEPWITAWKGLPHFPIKAERKDGLGEYKSGTYTHLKPDRLRRRGLPAPTYDYKQAFGQSGKSIQYIFTFVEPAFSSGLEEILVLVCGWLFPKRDDIKRVSLSRDAQFGMQRALDACTLR